MKRLYLNILITSIFIFLYAISANAKSKRVMKQMHGFIVIVNSFDYDIYFFPSDTLYIDSIKNISNSFEGRDRKGYIINGIEDYQKERLFLRDVFKYLDTLEFCIPIPNEKLEYNSDELYISVISATVEFQKKTVYNFIKSPYWRNRCIKSICGKGYSIFINYKYIVTLKNVVVNPFP